MLHIALFYCDRDGFRRSPELWGIGTAHGTETCLVSARTVDIIFCLDDVLSLGEHIDVIVRGAVLRGTVGTLGVTAQLAHRLHAGGTTVDELYEVVVTVGGDSDTYLDTVAHLDLTLRQDLAGDGET